MREIEISFLDRKGLHLGAEIKVKLGEESLTAFKLNKGNKEKELNVGKSKDDLTTKVFIGGDCK